MGLNAGDLTRPVTIQQLAESRGSSGFPVESWTTLIDTAWMSREEVRGFERFTGGQISAPATTRWQMRYTASMDPELLDVPKKRRLLYSGRTYDITSASQIGRQDGIELLTLTKAN